MLSCWAFPRVDVLGTDGVVLGVAPVGLPQGGLGRPHITGLLQTGVPQIDHRINFSLRNRWCGVVLRSSCGGSGEPLSLPLHFFPAHWVSAQWSCVCILFCEWPHFYAFPFLRVCSCVYACMCVCVLCVCVCVRVYVCVCLSACVCLLACMHVCLFVAAYSLYLLYVIRTIEYLTIY